MMRKRLAFFGVLALVFALALPCHSAFALDIFPDGSYWGGVTESGTYGSIVRASNKYDAAVYAIGEDPNTLSDEVKAKLSDPNYGGNFYAYASEFYNVTGFDSIPGFVPTYVVGSFTALAFTWERVFAAETATSLRDAAIVDYRRVLAGEDLSGTPEAPPVTDGEYMYFRGNPLYVDNTGFNYSYYRSGGVSYTLCVGQTQYTLFPAPLVVRVPLSAVSDLLASYPTDSYSWFLDISFYNGAITDSSIMIGNLAVTYATVNGVEGIKSVSGSYHYANLLKQYFTFDGSTSTFTYTTGHGTTGTWSSTPTSSEVHFILGTDFVSAPPAPDGDWPEPETPVTPDPPEVPTPTTPTNTPDPEPTAPTVVWPTAPIVVNPPEVTVEVTPSGIDYTELLTLINDNLNSIDAYTQAINSCLNSLRADIVGGFDDVVTSLRNVYQYLTHLNDVLEVHCKHIRDSIDQNVYELELYLKSLFEWLPQQLDYDAQFTYDDSAVTTLLYRILNKIPGSNGSPITYKPNPQSDEPGFLDWLLDLWHRFLIDLVSVLPDSLGGLVDSFSQLTHYFPFSIPWDLFALLALFEHEPVTPVFDVPLGFGGGENDVVLVRVDLTAWDSVMAFIRPVFVVGFCIKLALITKDLLSNFDIHKGGV